jgi:hypothetical protein
LNLRQDTDRAAMRAGGRLLPASVSQPATAASFDD